MSSRATVDDFLDEHGDALGRLAYHLTGEREAALDLVQDTLLRLMGRWHRVQAANQPLAYVRRALVNQHLNLVRRVQPLTVSDVPETEVGRRRADPTSAYDELDAMWQALGDLTDRQRTVLVLRYYEDLPDTEIAAVVGCRQATVRSLAARGLAQLRQSPHLHSTDPRRVS